MNRAYLTIESASTEVSFRISFTNGITANVPLVFESLNQIIVTNTTTTAGLTSEFAADFTVAQTTISADSSITTTSTVTTTIIETSTTTAMLTTTILMTKTPITAMMTETSSGTMTTVIMTESSTMTMNEVVTTTLAKTSTAAMLIVTTIMTETSTAAMLTGTTILAETSTATMLTVSTIMAEISTATVRAATITMTETSTSSSLHTSMTETPIITTIATTGATAFSQCSNYTLVTNGTRNANYTIGNACDSRGPLASPGWFRFSGAAGTILANYTVPSGRCDTQAPGWYTGVYSSVAYSTTSGTVCYHWGGSSCYWNNTILVTNCDGYYVFHCTPPPDCNLVYCTI